MSEVVGALVAFAQKILQPEDCFQGREHGRVLILRGIDLAGGYPWRGNDRGHAKTEAGEGEQRSPSGIAGLRRILAVRIGNVLGRRDVIIETAVFIVCDNQTALRPTLWVAAQR